MQKRQCRGAPSRLGDLPQSSSQQGTSDYGGPAGPTCTTKNAAFCSSPQARAAQRENAPVLVICQAIRLWQFIDIHCQWPAQLLRRRPTYSTNLCRSGAKRSVPALYSSELLMTQVDTCKKVSFHVKDLLHENDDCGCLLGNLH